MFIHRSPLNLPWGIRRHCYSYLCPSPARYSRPGDRGLAAGWAPAMVTSKMPGCLPALIYTYALISCAAAQQQDGGSTVHAKPAAHHGPSDRLTEAHGVLMAVSFVAILPISAIFAATRDRLFGPRVWFQTHRALGLLAAVLVMVGTILGIIAWTEFTRVKRLLLAHMVIGLILFGFVVIQVAGALSRPSHKSNLRRWWAPVHHNVGRLALLLGFANAIIGTNEAHMQNSWYVWICVVWGIIMLCAIGLILYARSRPQVPAAAGKLPSGTASRGGPHATPHDTPYV